jgi:hypothetical protein
MQEWARNEGAGRRDRDRDKRDDVYLKFYFLSPEFCLGLESSKMVVV